VPPRVRSDERWCGAMGRSASCLFGSLGETFGGPPDRFEMPVVEITELATVGEQHPIALPVEAVGQDHLAIGACRDVPPATLIDEVDGRTHPITELEVELTVVGLAERVGLPELHADILPDRTSLVHVHRSGSSPRCPRAEAASAQSGVAAGSAAGPAGRVHGL